MHSFPDFFELSIEVFLSQNLSPQTTKCCLHYRLHFVVCQVFNNILLYNFVMEIMAKRLNELRKEKGLAQKDVAEYLGITKSAYGFYEQNRREPSPETIKKLADYFEVSADYLLGRTDKER